MDLLLFFFFYSNCVLPFEFSRLTARMQAAKLTIFLVLFIRPYAILGLDQMRRFKCLVDLDEGLLVFGGKGGVTEPFLPQEEAMVVAQQMMNMQENPPTPTTGQGGGGGGGTNRPNNNNKSAGGGGLLKSIFKR